MSLVGEYLTPQRACLVNPFQLDNKTIIYGDSQYFIVDDKFKILEHGTLQEQLVLARRQFNLRGYGSQNCMRFHHVWLCCGRLYALVRDMLFQLDLLQARQIVRLPGEDYKAGYNRICTYGRQLLLTNNTQFFTFDPETEIVTPLQIKCANAMTSEQFARLNDTGVYSFGAHTIIEASDPDSNFRYIFQLFGDTAILLFAARNIASEFNSMGLLVYTMLVGQNDISHKVVFDLTQIKVVPQVVKTQFGRIPYDWIVFCAIQQIVPEALLRDILPDYDAYVFRCEVINHRFVRFHDVFSLARSDSALQPEIAAFSDYKIVNCVQLQQKWICFNANSATIIDSCSNVVLKKTKLHIFNINRQREKDIAVYLQKAEIIDVPVHLSGGESYVQLAGGVFRLQLDSLHFLFELSAKTAWDEHQIAAVGEKLIYADALGGKYLYRGVENDQNVFASFVGGDSAERAFLFSYGNTFLAVEHYENFKILVDVHSRAILYAAAILKPLWRITGLVGIRITDAHEDELTLIIDLTTSERWFVTGSIDWQNLPLLRNELGCAEFPQSTMMTLFQQDVRKLAAFRERRNNIAASFDRVKYDKSEAAQELNHFMRPLHPELYTADETDVFGFSVARRLELEKLTTERYQKAQEQE